MIKIEKRDNIDIVTFSVNKLHALISDDIRNEINNIFEIPNSKVVIDLTGVEYIDSSGFGCFLSVMKTGRSNYGVLKFCNPDPNVIKLFHTLHLHTVFDIYDDLETCLKSFK